MHAATLNRFKDSQPSVAHRSLLRLQRKYGNRYVQRVLAIARQGATNSEIAPEVESTINSARGSGRALDSAARAQMESSFGADFGGVRVHTDSQANSLNQSLSARAFTTGKDIFFGQGEYNPGSSAGQELLALQQLEKLIQ